MRYELDKEAIVLLIEGSKKAIPFNIILASLLAPILLYHQMPYLIVGAWYFAIVVLSLIRWQFCNKIIKNELFEEKKKPILNQFVFLTLIMGCIWGSCYLIALPYVTDLYEFIIILVFGGMCAGAIATLSVYLPAYYAYIVPMFLPVILYNYLIFNLDRALLATMFFLFVVMLIVSAKINKKLLDRTFQLSNEKELLIKELLVVSITDPLTGLYNRRHFESMLPQEINRAKRSKSSLNLISMDVDNFKLINDNFGHPYGDKFLIGIGHLLQKTCRRSTDIVFRLGGDEFAAILANQPLEAAINVCQSISNLYKKTLPSTDFNEEKQDIFNQVTLSMGIVAIHFDYRSTIETVINAADKALYQAKRKGKNQIVIKELH